MSASILKVGKWQRGRSAQRRRGGALASQRRFVISVVIPTALYTSIGLFSLVWGLALMFFEYSSGRLGGPILGLGESNPFVGLEHFVNMVNGVSREARLFRTSLRNTFIFALVGLPLNLAITLPLAALVESVKGWLKGFYRAIYFLPVVTAQVGVAMMWSYIYDPQSGLLNMIVRFFGAKPVAWLADPRATFLGVSVAMWAVLVARLWSDYGYNMVIFIAALQNIPQQLKEAALIDGANAWQAFTRVTVPLLRPTLLFVCVMTVLDAFQVFGLIQVMTNGGPNYQTHVMMLDIYDNAFRYQRMGWAAAVGWALTLIVMGITLVQMRLLRTEWEY